MTTLDDVLEALQPLRTRARTLTKNLDDAEDLVHDTFVRAARFIDKFQPHTSLGSWLNTMMYRVFLDGLRHGDGKTGKYSYRRRMVSIETLPGFDIPCESTAAAEWDCERLIHMVARLRPNHRLAVEMVAEGASYEDISRAMGCGVTTVKTRLNRARHALKEQINVFD